jgi:serine/threonine-protein kinase
VANGSDGLFAHFEALLGLPPAERGAALAALQVDDDTRRELRALLDADARSDTRIDRVLEGGAQRLSALPAGLRLGPWKVLREIGAGGMGTVFLGERVDGAFAQQVAIKVLRGFPTEDGMRRLRQERNILAELDHPNIARLLDGGETPEGQPFLVMEYVDGVPLAQWLAQAPTDVVPRLVLFDKLAAAVAHAHRQLVIHRDLKPGNVIVRADGEPKLLDFGVARLAALESGEGSTRVATIGWASPEQAAGGAVTTASDVYSLGVILRVLLGGRDDRQAGAPAPLADAELRGVIAMATAADPARRYPGVDALRDDLVAWRERRPLRALPDTALYRTRKFVARHRAGVLLGAMAAIAVTLFVFGLERALREAREARDAAQAAQRESETQRQIAQRVGDFMTEMFAGANSADTGGKVLTARDVIGSASEKLLRDETLDRESRVTLLERLASTLVGLRDPKGALALIERAQVDHQALAPARAARLDYTHARILARLDRREEAESLNQRALQVLQDDPSDPALLTRVLQQSMWLANGAQDYERTLTLAPQALAAWARSANEEPLARATILNSRFIAEYALGRNEQMLESLRAAWQDLRQAEGSAAFNRAQAGSNLAISLIDLGRTDEAGAVLDELEPFVRRVFATDSRTALVRMLRMRAEWWLATGQPERALAVVAEAEQIDRGLEPAQRSTDTLGVTRAFSLLALGQWQAAIDAAEQVAAGGLPAPEAGLDPMIARAYLARAIAHCRLGQPALAVSDATASTTIVADLVPTQLERLVVERWLRSLSGNCRGP